MSSVKLSSSSSFRVPPVIHEMDEAKHDSLNEQNELSIKPTSDIHRVKPNLQRKGSETEQRLASMRERFSMLQVMEEGEQENSPMVDLGTGQRDSPVAALLTPASARWSKLRKVVNWPKQQQQLLQQQNLVLGNVSRKNSLGALSTSADSSRTSPTGSPQISPRGSSSKQKRKIIKRPSDNDMRAKMEEEARASIELEDISLGQLWTDTDIPFLSDPLEDLPSLTLISDREEFKTEMVSEVFNEDSKHLSLSVSRIPEAVVQAKREEIERQVQEERLLMLEKLRKREIDIDYREMSAKDAVQAKEREARRRLDAEKQKVASVSLKKQKNLAQDFKKMREELEVGIKRQQGAVKEHFGKMLVHEETLARRFQASSKMSPQPVEFRIHLLRAVKNKLPKGCYVLMLTQYDSLGGRPLSWSRIGANGIGNLRPGITRSCKHEGRYFDRMLRVEDSCFALCPPRPLLKPNFVFVLELFQLASKHNPCDKIEAWTALPMTYESMSIVEGKFKLPLIRGEHSQSVQHFKTMERMMAEDLHNWLCNIYIEVRHMSMNELGVSNDMLKTTDFDMDYFNKSFIPLDVDGKPILSRAKQEQMALEEELEAAGFAVPGGGGGGGGGEAVPVTLSSKIRASQAAKLIEPKETDENYEVPLLPVDKGIFRRKLGAPGAEASEEEANNYGNTVSALGTNSYVGGGGVGGGSSARSVSSNPGMAAGSSSAHPASSSQQQPQNDGDGEGSESDGEKKKHKSARLTSIKEEHAASSQSLLQRIGLSRNSTVSNLSSNTPLLLKNDDNFLEHRKLLIQRWKDNIRNKYPRQPSPSPSSRQNGSSFLYPEKDEEVLERGYNIQDEVFLHREQRGKLAGVETLSSKEARQWAAAGLEGKIVRRWQSEGPRFDSEAVADPELGASQSNAALGLPHETKAWEELRDVREMEDYTMSISADPSRKKSVVPGSKSASKIRYIKQEMFGDLDYYLWGTFEFYMAIFIYLFALWIRIFVHYLAQYLYLVSLNTPVFNFRMMVFQIVQKYMSASISVAAEVGVVAMGPIANLCVYICMVGLAVLFQKTGTHMPDVLSKFFIAFGFASILDPALVIIIDVIYHNYNCTSSSDACAADYTSKDCNCFNGDFAKLWYRMSREEGSGLTGLFITVLLYMGTGIIGCLALYQYIVYVHRDGRVLDQWRRINGTIEEFFMPMDFEVSDEELQTIVYKAVHWRGPKGSRRRLEVQEFTEMDPEDANYLEHYKKFIIVEVDEKKNTSVFREFQLEPSGALLEIFDSRSASYRNRSIFSKDSAVDLVGQTDREEGSGGEEKSQHSDDHSPRSNHSRQSRYSQHSSNRDQNLYQHQRGDTPQRGAQILSSERSPLLGSEHSGSDRSGGPDGGAGAGAFSKGFNAGMSTKLGRSPSGVSSRKGASFIQVNEDTNVNNYEDIEEINPVPRRSQKQLSFKDADL